MKNISDMNGRAFEFMFVQALEDNFDVVLTARARQDQDRDQDKPSLIDPSVRAGFDSSLESIIGWLATKIDGENLVADRLSDSDGKKGDVTDVKISSGGSVLNLSLKHNHYALKHQRPPTLCTQMGFARGGAEDTVYRTAYNAVLAQFLMEARTLLPRALKFRELETRQPGFKNQFLYLPVCALIHKTYAQYGQQKRCAQTLFNFLVGNTGFYKIVVVGERVEVFDFQNIQLPTAFRSRFDLSKPSYIHLDFNNGWKLSLRLHTASGRITPNVSLKFDTQFSRNAPDPVLREVL